MPNPKVFEAKALYDHVRDVSQGMNAGVDPLLIPNNQLAYARNVTVRGTFPTHRPAYFNRPLVYSDPNIQSPFETGVFQGAGYYKPDIGPEGFVVAISGRLFFISIVANTPSVSEITIAGDANSAAPQQVWMWQAERWMIIQDGQSNPIFYDGTVARRSLGFASVAGTTNSNFTMPAVGSTVSGVTLASNFTGQFNQTYNLFSVSGFLLGQVTPTVSSATGFVVTLKNRGDQTGATYAIGTPVFAGPAPRAYSGQTVTFPNTGGTLTIQDITDLSAYFGQNVIINGRTFTLISQPSTTQIRLSGFGGGSTAIAIGDIIRVQGDASSTSQVATLQVAFTAPGLFTSQNATLTAAYPGQVGDLIVLGGKYYSVAGISSGSAATTTLNILNVSCATGTIASGATIVTNEIPAGKMGAYGLGRSWQSMTDGRSFLAGDIVGGSSGSPPYQKRDAVLKVNENTLLNGGGTFSVPGQVGDIRALIFTSVLDAALGQGPLAVLTPKTVFSCQAPTDRTTWQNLTSPILTESMKGAGGTSQESTILANSDVLMRSNDGIRSYIQARRDFNVWGNVPISREVEPIVATDPDNLKKFSSAVEFDNRALYTTTPVQSIFGVYWTQLIALNFDPISSLRGKAPSVYDGVWDGLNVLRILAGTFADSDRCFAICVSSDLTKIQLTEILKSSDSTFQDNGTTRIQWEYYTADLNFDQEDPGMRDFLKLMDGELRCDDLNETLYHQPITQSHNVDFEVFYRPDQNPAWVPWNSWTETFATTNDPGFRTGMGLGKPSSSNVDTTNNRPSMVGISMQFRVRITGHCRMILHRFKAETIPEADFPKPNN